MRDFVLLVSSSSSSSPSISPNSNPNPNLNPSPNRHCRSSSKSAKLSSSSSLSAASASRSPPLSTLRFDSSSSSSKSRLRYFADFALRLARDGKLDDFAMILESLIVSGADASRLSAALRSEFAEKGFSELVRGGGGEVRGFSAVIGKLDELGFSLAEIFGGAAKEVLRRECRWILKSELLEEFVELVEVLAGFGFLIKELVKPHDVIKICVENRQPELAIRFACTLPHAHMLFCDTVTEFGKKRDLDSSLTAFESAKKNSNTVDMYLYRSIIDVCGRCHDYMKSRSIYQDLLSQKVTPNVYVFNSLMNTNASDLNYTLGTYRDMQNLGVQADMASYNILLKACCLAGRVDLAQDIYKEVRHLESTGVLKLDVFTFSTIVKALADARLWQMALRVKDDMLKSGVTPNTVTWSSLINACANAGIVEKALQLFDEMISSGCEPNTQCCNILLHACVEAFQYDRAFRLFDSWKRSDDNNNNNLYGLSLAKDLSFAPTEATYNILIKACGSDYDHAKRLVGEMKSVGLSPNHITWCILIDICGSSQDVERVVQILKTMRATGIEPDVIAYTTVIKVCVENNYHTLAFELFAEMKTYQIKPNLVTYNTLLRARSRYGSLQEVKQCLAVYQDMRRAGYNSNDYYLKQLIEEWCEGVIQENNVYHQVADKSGNNALLYKERSQSFLLEKVAEHLEMHISESLAVDVQGLTNVEARILVLAVLRMVKENCFMGQMVKDDMFIVLGVIDDDVVSNGSEIMVQQAITKLLQHELGLEVLQSGIKIAPIRDQLSSQKNRGTKYPTRKPLVIVQRLKVTKKSLQQWLQRKVSHTR